MTRFWKTVLLIMLIGPLMLMVALFVVYASVQTPQSNRDAVVRPPEPVKREFYNLPLPAPTDDKLVRDDVGDLRLDALREKAALAEKRSIERASIIRERLKQSEGVNDAEVKKAVRTELRVVVLEAFKARQELHAAEVASLEKKAESLKQRLVERDASSAEIVDRRVDELLNPDKQWNSIVPAGETKVSDTDVRLYAIQDLPLWSKDGTSQHIDLLILYLEPRVDSTKNGGDKIGSYEAGRGVLVVRGDARKHQQIAQLLTDLRASVGQPAEELAKEKSVTLYSIANLPLWSKDGKKQNVDLLVSYLRVNVDPPSWKSQATRAAYNAETLSLVVQGTQEVHNGIKAALSRLRGQTELSGAENASTSNVPSTKSNSAEPLPGDDNKLLIRRSETSVKVEGRFDGNEEIVLVIGDPRFTALANTAQELKDVKELKWTSPVHKAGEYVIEVRQDAVKLDGGATAPGLVFEVHNVPNTVQGTSNISFTDKDPLPNGKVVIAAPKTKLLLKRKTDQVLVTVGHVELPNSLTVVPINIVIRRRAEANSVNRVEVPVDAKGTVPLPKPQKDAGQASEIFDEILNFNEILNRKNARAVVEAFVAAAIAGDEMTINTLAPISRSQAGVELYVGELKFLKLTKLRIESVYVNDLAKPTKALATSVEVRLEGKTPRLHEPRGGFLVLTLSMSENGWSVTDIDFDSKETADRELKKFLEANPRAIGLPPLTATARTPVTLKILHADGSPASVRHGVSIATMGYSANRPRLQFFSPNKEGSVSLANLPDGQHLLLLDSGWEHRDLMSLSFPVPRPIVEWRLPKRTEFAGTKVELKSSRAATDAGIEVLRLQIHNATAAALHVSERDITLTIDHNFRILSPRFLIDAQDHHLTKELVIDIAPGETKSLDLDWADWVRHGYWAKRNEDITEVTAQGGTALPGSVWVRPWLGNIGSSAIALTGPETIVTADASGADDNHSRHPETKRSVPTGDAPSGADSNAKNNQLDKLDSAPARECRALIKRLDDDGEVQLAAAARERLAKRWKGITEQPPASFTRQLSRENPNNVPDVSGELVSIQTELDGFWSDSKGTVEDWTNWIIGKQADYRTDRLKLLFEAAQGYRKSDDAKSAARVLRAGLNGHAIYDKELSTLIPLYWPVTNDEPAKSLGSAAHLGTLVNFLRELSATQQALGELDDAVETQSRLMLASFMLSWNQPSGEPTKSARDLWSLIRQQRDPKSPLFWFNVVHAENPEHQFDLAGAGQKGNPLTYHHENLVAQPSLNFNELTITATTHGRKGILDCLRINSKGQFESVGVLTPSADGEADQVLTQTLKVPAETGMVQFMVAGEDFRVGEMKVNATFTKRDAAVKPATDNPGTTSPYGTSSQLDQASASKSDPVSDRVRAKLEALFQKHYPKATLANRGVEGIHVEHEVATFEFPSTGGKGAKREAEKQQGPKKGGILCSVYSHPGRYLGPLQLSPVREGQVAQHLIDRKEYKQLLMAPYSQKSDVHMWVALSYPPDTDKAFLDKFREIMADFEKAAE